MESNGRKNPDKDNLERILSIDPHQLEKEWCEQSKLYYLLDVAAADADQEVREAKANFELVKAELAKKVRRRPVRYGLARSSEAGIDSVIVTLSEYQEAQERYNHTQHEAAVAHAAVQSLWHRKKGLEKCVDLLLAGYFSAPKAPEGVRDRMNHLEKEAVRKPVRRKS